MTSRRNGVRDRARRTRGGSRRLRRRRTLATTLPAVAVLALPVLSGCGTSIRTVDCTKTADEIAKSANLLQEAASTAADDPKGAREAIKRVNRDLNRFDALGNTAESPDLAEVVQRMRTAMKDADDALDHKRTPDLTAVESGIGELGRICVE
ncbi:hypothetical protein [Streptomyces sp. MST-110588]|uniref:hypothetical protein n=1 Tax=Streptomyces sp. MST-110588 TaxID=2833628 RepID=UPI001F5C37C4|nr:hypothetical protein [Streptomyces sp. MST-110588]UNO41826.1 hypothetical protein KGS77_22625 [Streptomyces sp. MST-110588]